MERLADLSPAALQALEDLLRRVLRSPHGLDLAELSSAARATAEVRLHRRARRGLWVVVLLAALAAVLVLGWFVGGRWAGS